jgi:pimeloyl-ACP methyl ester carboxylesterase
MRASLALLLGAALAAPATAPPPLRMTDPCVGSAERKHVVRFASADRTRLIGVMLGTGPKGVVLVHGHGGNLCSWLPYARTLARLGFRVLAYDSRSHGSSGQARLLQLDLDVRGAARELRRRGARRVVLAGSSAGASAVLVGAAFTQPPVRGVVSLSAPRGLGPVDAEKAMPRLRVPVLFIAAEKDDGLAAEARLLHETAAATDKRLEIVPSGEHGTDLLRLPRVQSLVTGFIRERLALG